MMKYYTERAEDMRAVFLITHLVETLTRTECEKLLKGVPIAIGKEFKPTLERFFRGAIHRRNSVPKRGKWGK